MWNTFNVARPSPDQPNSLPVSLEAQGWEWKFGFSKKICRNHENIKHNTSAPLSIGHYDLLKTKKYPETPLSWTHSNRHAWAWLGNSAHIQPVLILHAIFRWLLSLCKKFKTLFVSFQEILMIKGFCNFIGWDNILAYNLKLCQLNYEKLL